MKGWRTGTIGEFTDTGGGDVKTGPFGSQLHQSDYQATGTPVVMPANILNGKFNQSKIARVSDGHVNRLHKHKLSVGDIIYGRRGDIGRQALVRDENVGWLCGTGCLRITLGDAPIIPEFLHLYLQLPEIIGWIQNQAIGATMPNLNTQILRRVPVWYPNSKEEQRKIAAVLSAYDDLIENNNRRIAILEKMAEEIYREWFVRMRFPGHEKVKFRKGVPEGWEIKRVKDIVDRKSFGRIYREKELINEGRVVVIDQSLKDFLGFYNGKPEHEATIENPIILFGDHSCKMQLMMEPFSLAENVIPFISKDNMPIVFLYYLIKGKVETIEYKRHWTELTNKQVFIPDSELQDQFSKITKEFILKTNQLQRINIKLSKSRDPLISLLISGKLSVEDLNIQFPKSMEETGA